MFIRVSVEARRRCGLRRLVAVGLVAALPVLLLLQATIPVLALQEREIAYDNGILGGSVSLPYAPVRWSRGVKELFQNVEIGSDMLAVRFTPEEGTVQMLLGARLYIAGDLASFNLWVFDYNRQYFMYGDFNPQMFDKGAKNTYAWTVTPTSIGWVYVNFTAAYPALPIFVGDDFYVAMEFMVDHKPSLGVDTTGPRSNRGWFAANGTDTGWSEYSAYAKQNGLLDGNLMIRVVTTTIIESTSVTTSLTTSVTTGVTGSVTGSAKNAPARWQLPTVIMLEVLLAVAAVEIWQKRKPTPTR